MMCQREQELGQSVCSTQILSGNQKEICIYALAAAANEVAAAGAKITGADMKIRLPFGAFKSKINGRKKLFCKTADEMGIQTVHAEGSFSPAVQYPTVVVTAYGEKQILHDAEAKSQAERKEIHPGQDIVIMKRIGIAGTLFVLGEKEAELARRFTPTFLNQVRDLQSQIFAVQEIETARRLGAGWIRQVPEGGILAALHYLSEETGLGLSVDMKKLPVWQETIEICEHFRLNPYQLLSVGCMLLIAENGDTLAEKLKTEGIEAVVIGQLTDNHDKIIRNGEDIRYVDRPAPDEWMKIFTI